MFSLACLLHADRLFSSGILKPSKETLMPVTVKAVGGLSEWEHCEKLSPSKRIADCCSSGIGVKVWWEENGIRPFLLTVLMVQEIMAFTDIVLNEPMFTDFVLTRVNVAKFSLLWLV